MFSSQENAGLRDGSLIRQIGHKSFSDIYNINDILVPTMEYLVNNDYNVTNGWKESKCIGSAPSYSVTGTVNNDNPFILEVTKYNRYTHWLTIYAERPIKTVSIKKTQLVRLLDNIRNHINDYNYYSTNKTMMSQFNNTKLSDYNKVEFWFTTLLVLFVLSLIYLLVC